MASGPSYSKPLNAGDIVLTWQYDFKENKEPYIGLNFMVDNSYLVPNEYNGSLVLKEDIVVSVEKSDNDAPDFTFEGVEISYLGYGFGILYIQLTPQIPKKNKAYQYVLKMIGEDSGETVLLPFFVEIRVKTKILNSDFYPTIYERIEL